MNLANFSYLLTLLYYAGAVSHIYCRLLTPRRSHGHTFALCCLFWIPEFLIVLFDYRNTGPTLWIITLLPLCLFCDSWKRRISCFVIVYLVMTANEAISSTVAYLLISWFAKDKLTTMYYLKADPKNMIITAVIIVAIGIPLVLSLTKSLQAWFRYIQTGTLALLGLPLVISILQNIPVMTIGIPTILLIFPFLICSLLLRAGFLRMHRQELLRNQRENQHAFIQKQISYSRELENEYLRLRRWNHDIANHFLALSYLLENGRYQEGSDYIRCLTNKVGKPTSTPLSP